MNSSDLKKILFRYAAEIVAIFIGITISFVFDRWREEQQEKKEQMEFVRSLLTDLQTKRNEIAHDNPQALIWIDRLDSIQRGRATGDIERKQLVWFFRIMLRGGTFFFNATTPTYTGTENSGYWKNLPDTIRRKIYHIYMEDFVFNKVAYEQLGNAMNQFRNSVMTTSGMLALNLNEKSSKEDIDTFRREIVKPEYGGIIQAIIVGEQFLFDKGELTKSDIDRLILDLERMTKEDR